MARLLRAGHCAKRISALILTLVAVIAATAYAQVRLNAWNEPFYDALTRKDVDAFLTQLGVFAVLAGLLLVLNVAQRWLDLTLKLTLRRGLFLALLNEWMKPGRAPQLARAGRIGDNPDQRLQADVDGLADLSVALGVGLFQATLLLFAFIGVLWRHSAGLVLPIGEHSYQIPGFMVWCALFYASAASWLSWRVGRKLVAMTAESAAREADFRFEIVRVNEAAESVTLQRGEAAEARRIEAVFTRLAEVIEAVIRATVGLTWVTAGYGWFTLVAPILAVAPFYFTTDMTIGELMLVVGAFNQVQGSLRWFVNNFAAIATWRATLLRVTSFHRALIQLPEHVGTGGPGRIARREAGGAIEIHDLWVVTPHVSVRLAEDEIRLEPGGRLLLHGKSGSGKTILFRALAGLWDRGEGQILMPAAAKVIYMPTRAYLLPGSLRHALCYPLPGDSYPRAEIEAALVLVGLGQLSPQLDSDDLWDRVLSESEKQCLSLARVLLDRPDWLVMDDTLSQLDPEVLPKVAALLKGELAQVGILGIGNAEMVQGLFPRQVEILTGPGVPLAAGS